LDIFRQNHENLSPGERVVKAHSRENTGWSQCTEQGRDRQIHHCKSSSGHKNNWLTS